jgi:hypothetical protein
MPMPTQKNHNGSRDYRSRNKGRMDLAWNRYFTEFDGKREKSVVKIIGE